MMQAQQLFQALSIANESAKQTQLKKQYTHDKISRIQNIKWKHP